MINAIYLLTNKLNNKKYVGQTWEGIVIRWQKHCAPSNTGCVKLHNAIMKYGRDNFYYEVLVFCSTQESADYWECYFIEKFDTIYNGYNIRGGGSRGIISEETKQKISKANTGKIRSDQSRKNMSKGQIGKKYSKERNEKISNSLKGKPGRRLGKKNSKEHNEALLLSRIGKPGGMLGKKHSNETKQKMSNAQKGKKRPPRTDEWKRKQSIAQKGKSKSNTSKKDPE